MVNIRQHKADCETWNCMDCLFSLPVLPWFRCMLWRLEEMQIFKKKATVVYSQKVTTIIDQFSTNKNDSCNYLWKSLLESLSQPHSFPFQKSNISYNCGNFLQITTIITLHQNATRKRTPPPPSPPLLAFDGCLIHRVRNFKGIFSRTSTSVPTDITLTFQHLSRDTG